MKMKMIQYWCLVLYLVQCIQLEFANAQDLEFEEEEEYEMEYVSVSAFEEIPNENEIDAVVDQNAGDVRADVFDLPQGVGELVTYTTDNTVYVAQVYPTFTLTLSTLHNKMTFTTHLLATSVIENTSEYVSYDYNFDQPTPTTHSSTIKHTTRKKTSVVGVGVTKTEHTSKKTYPAFIKTLYSEMNASKRWWKSVISESKEHLATYVLGPVSTAPELYLTTTAVVSTFKMWSTGWMVHYVETIPKLVTLTARGVTHVVTQRQNFEYTLTSVLESEWVSEQILTVHGSTIILYYTRYLTEEDGVVKTVTVGGTTEDVIPPVPSPTEELPLETPTVGSSQIETYQDDFSITADSSTTEYTPEHSTIYIETVELKNPYMMPYRQEQPPPEYSSQPLLNIPTEPTEDPVESVSSASSTLTPTLTLTFATTTVGPHNDTTTVHTEATFTIGTDDKETPAIIYHVKTPAVSTFTSIMTTVGPYSYTTTILTETTRIVGTDGATSPGRVYHVDVPQAIQYTSATTTEGPFSFTTTILTETTFTTGKDGSLVINNIYHVNTPSQENAPHDVIANSNSQSNFTDPVFLPSAITLSPQENDVVNISEASSSYWKVQSTGTGISGSATDNINSTDRTDNITNISNGSGDSSSTSSRDSSTVLNPPKGDTPDASTTTTVGFHSFTTTYHTEITYTVGLDGITTPRTIFHVKTPAATQLTSTVITVGPYESLTTRLTETTYVTGSDGSTTPQIIYHVRVPPVSVMSSATTTVGPYGMTTTVFTEETYIEGPDGNQIPKLIEHVNTPDTRFIATADPPEPEGRIVHTSTEILVFVGEDGGETTSTAYHVFVLPVPESTLESEPTQQESATHPIETEVSSEKSSTDLMTVHRSGVQSYTTIVSNENTDTSIAGENSHILTTHPMETPIARKTELSRQSVSTADVNYLSAPLYDDDVGHLLTYFTGGAESRNFFRMWECVCGAIFLMIL